MHTLILDKEMKMFRKYFDIALIALLIAGALSVAVIVVVANRPASAAAMPVEKALILQTTDSQNPPASADNPLANTAALPKNAYPIAQTKNNIKIELLGVKLKAGFLYADLCFDFPSDNPAWELGGPDNLKLSNGVAEIGVYSIEMIPDPQTGLLKKDDQGRFAGRCDHVGFPLPQGFALENLKISIEKLVTAMPESPDCSQAQAKLDSKNLGIKIKCPAEPGLSGFEIIAKPNGMDQTLAQTMVTEALVESVEGPWEFEIGIP